MPRTPPTISFPDSIAPAPRSGRHHEAGSARRGEAQAGEYIFPPDTKGSAQKEGLSASAGKPPKTRPRAGAPPHQNDPYTKLRTERPWHIEKPILCFRKSYRCSPRQVDISVDPLVPFCLPRRGAALGPECNVFK